MGGSKVDKSAPTPLYLFDGTRSSLSPSVSTNNTTATTETAKENKRRGENSQQGYLHGLSFFNKHKAQADHWPLDLPKQQDVGPFSLSFCSCCCC